MKTPILSTEIINIIADYVMTPNMPPEPRERSSNLNNKIISIFSIIDHTHLNLPLLDKVGVTI